MCQTRSVPSSSNATALPQPPLLRGGAITPKKKPVERANDRRHPVMHGWTRTPTSVPAMRSGSFAAGSPGASTISAGPRPPATLHLKPPPHRRSSGRLPWTRRSQIRGWRDSVKLQVTGLPWCGAERGNVEFGTRFGRIRNAACRRRTVSRATSPTSAPHETLATCRATITSKYTLTRPATAVSAHERHPCSAWLRVCSDIPRSSLSSRRCKI